MEAEDNLGWDWSKSSNSLTYSGNFHKLVNCSYIKSIDDSNTSDYSKAVLDPTLSTYAQEHPDFDPFILLNDNKSL